MLEIRDLHAGVAGREILRGVDLTIRAGEVHAIMGPNGSGKSTLAGVLAGRDLYEVTEGDILYEGKDLLEMDPEERAREGIFLAFQHPIEIPGVSNKYFLRAALNAIRKHRGQEECDALEFLNIIKNSAVALTIGLVELTARARAMQEFSFQVFEAFAAATTIYIVINIVVTTLMRRLEAQLAVPGYLGAAPQVVTH